MPLLLYAFRYRDPRTGKWVKARYRAELEVIRGRYAEFETIGDPEVRQRDNAAFNPFRKESPDVSRYSDVNGKE